jgi:transcriptional regulator with XRE-family HTH domain
MTRLRTLLAKNLKVYRNEMGFSQQKLADLVDTAPNYIAMIEAEKRFPSDTMLEKIAEALQKEPCELFSTAFLLESRLQETLLVDFTEFMSHKMNALPGKPSAVQKKDML